MISTGERRQIENEMIFRRTNEKVADGLNMLDAMYAADGQTEFIDDEDRLLMFKCECSDENCEVRIPMQLSQYQKIHEDRRNFIVKPNHQVARIEQVVRKEDEYFVVKKKHVPSEPDDDTLHATTVHNV